jgi:alkylhydroperoxidase family enzyme
VGIDWRAATTDDVITAVLAAQPDVAAHLLEAHRQAWAAVDPRLLELARLRVAMLLGNEAELATHTPDVGLDDATVAELGHWPTSPLFDTTDRAVLDFVEQWVIDVASVTDAQAAAVSDALGPEGLATFAAAFLVIEQRQRLRLAWTRLFGEEAA